MIDYDNDERRFMQADAVFKNGSIAEFKFVRPAAVGKTSHQLQAYAEFLKHLSGQDIPVSRLPVPKMANDACATAVRGALAYWSQA